MPPSPPPDPAPPPAATAALLPGPSDALCLDFANTRYWRGSPEPTEELRAPEDLLRWCASAGTADPAAIAAARARWHAAPAEGEAALAAAIVVREAIFRLFAASAAGAAPGAEELAALNAALAAAPARRRLRCDPAAVPSGWAWEVPAAPADAATAIPPAVEALLAPVLWSAGDLLAGGRRARVRQCANARCLWLFLDDSKSGNRRWCSMASCGNRAKAHRHYARQKEGGQGR
jgi:predicted RNA-binding Zn ribbon-like protein